MYFQETYIPHLFYFWYTNVGKLQRLLRPTRVQRYQETDYKDHSKDFHTVKGRFQTLGHYDIVCFFDVTYSER